MAKPSFWDTVILPRCNGANPREYLIKEYEKTRSLRLTARFFNVHKSTVSKALKECRLMGYEFKGEAGR